MKKILFIALLFCSGRLQAQSDTALKPFFRSLERNFNIPLEFSLNKYNENLLLRVAFENDSIQDIRFSDGSPEVYHKELDKIKPYLNMAALQKAFAGKYKGSWSLLVPVFLHNQHKMKNTPPNTYITPEGYSLFEGKPLSGNMYLAKPAVFISLQVVSKPTAASKH